MQTIVRNGKVFTEYTPEELDAARLQAETDEMVRTGRTKSTHGAVDAGAFIPDYGHRKGHRLAH